MSTEVTSAVYWDSSAVLSALFQDGRSEEASRSARGSAVHFLSTLAWAEVHAVIARIERERALAKVLVAAAREALEEGPWRRLNAAPDWKVVRDLSSKWPLRGADLWHLAVAKGLQTEIPELTIMSFDARLAAAAKGEGLT
jgi:predicted nucleic acid-binding protein